jgi:hypothetical protein
MDNLFTSENFKFISKFDITVPSVSVCHIWNFFALCLQYKLKKGIAVIRSVPIPRKMLYLTACAQNSNAASPVGII